MSLTLLTLTGDRPDQFALCEFYMERQTTKWDEWIVVDDGLTPTKCTMGQRVIRLTPGKPPRESFVCNLDHGLRNVKTKNVAFIEDDDWYSAGWLDFVSSYLNLFALVGEAPSIYYNLASKCWRDMNNRHHASLCQTACSVELARHVSARCNNTYFDTVLWNQSGVPSYLDTAPFPMVVGLKGHATGRAGIGVGHRPQGERWTADPNGDQLRKLIGDDATLYGAKPCTKTA